MSADLLRPLGGVDELDMTKVATVHDMTAPRGHQADPVDGDLRNDAGVAQCGLEADVVKLRCSKTGGRMEEQMSRRVIANRIEINPLADSAKNPGLGCPREEDRKLSAFRNRSAKVGSGENAVVAIGQRLQGIPELSKGLHAKKQYKSLQKLQ